MKNKSWDIGILFVILMVTTIGIRKYYVSYLMGDIVINEEIYNHVKAIETGNVLAGLSSIMNLGMGLDTVYLALLYLGSFVFGSYTDAGVYLNIVYQVITITIIFLDIYIVTRKYYAFRISMLLAVFPTYIKSISNLDTYNLNFMLSIMAIIIIMMVYRRVWYVIDSIKNKESKVEQETDMKEITLPDDKPKHLDNPLPVPKVKEHKMMDYAIEVSDNDDFDIKELSDNDNFDI